MFSSNLTDVKCSLRPLDPSFPSIHGINHPENGNMGRKNTVLTSGCLRSRSFLSAVSLIAISILLIAANIFQSNFMYASKNGTTMFEQNTIAEPLIQSNARSCARLLASPEMRVKCKRDQETGWRSAECDNGTISFQSQFAQDYYLYTRHFQYLTRPGVYLDVAANEPIRISNTWVFDACLGWRGICVEANPFYVKRLQQVRSCQIVPNCVGDVEGEDVTFVLGMGRGGIEDTNKNMKQLDSSEKIALKCTTVANVMKKSAVTRVDYFTLDVEGHEMHVLRGIDWDKVIFNVITVEVSAKSKDGIATFLGERGYVRHIPTLSAETRKTGRLHMDYVYLHKDVTFGRPL